MGGMRHGFKAVPIDHGANHYKIELAPRVVARAILKMGETA